jgi:hypothetical protein
MDRIERLEVWAALAHDYGLYALRERIRRIGLRPRPNLNFETLNPDQRRAYEVREGQARSMGPWEARVPPPEEDPRLERYQEAVEELGRLFKGVSHAEGREVVRLGQKMFAVAREIRRIRKSIGERPTHPWFEGRWQELERLREEVLK